MNLFHRGEPFTLTDLVSGASIKDRWNRKHGEYLSDAVNRTAKKLGLASISAWNTVGSTPKTVDLHGLDITGNPIASVRVTL